MYARCEGHSVFPVGGTGRRRSAARKRPQAAPKPGAKRQAGDGEDGDVKAAPYLECFSPHQTGKAGDITAGLPPRDYGELPHIERYGKGGKTVACCRFFTPDSSWSFWATECDSEDTFFGLVDGMVKELG